MARQDTLRCWALGLEELNPRGLIVTHDALHFLVGEAVRGGIEAVTNEALYYLTSPSDCGLAIYQKPFVAADGEVLDVVTEKPKRKRR